MINNQAVATRNNAQTMTKMALCVALLAASAYISFPLPFTPAMVTSLTIVVNLIAFILPPKQALLVMATYLIIGAAGVPVFVGGAAGLGKLVGPTGGFTLGFLLAAGAMSALRGSSNNFKKNIVLGICVGMPLIYITGCLTMYVVAGLGLWATLVAAVFPFLLGDVIKVVLAAFLAQKLNAALVGR